MIGNVHLLFPSWNMADWFFVQPMVIRTNLNVLQITQEMASFIFSSQSQPFFNLLSQPYLNFPLLNLHLYS